MRSATMTCQRCNSRMPQSTSCTAQDRVRLLMPLPAGPPAAYRCACVLSLPAPALLLLPPAKALNGCRTVVQPMAAASRLRLVVRDVCTHKKNTAAGATGTEHDGHSRTQDTPPAVCTDANIDAGCPLLHCSHNAWHVGVHREPKQALCSAGLSSARAWLQPPRPTFPAKHAKPFP